MEIIKVLFTWYSRGGMNLRHSKIVFNPSMWHMWQNRLLMVSLCCHDISLACHLFHIVASSAMLLWKHLPWCAIWLEFSLPVSSNLTYMVKSRVLKLVTKCDAPPRSATDMKIIQLLLKQKLSEIYTSCVCLNKKYNRTHYGIIASECSRTKIVHPAAMWNVSLPDYWWSTWVCITSANICHRIL